MSETDRYPVIKQEVGEPIYDTDELISKTKSIVAEAGYVLGEVFRGYILNDDYSETRILKEENDYDTYEANMLPEAFKDSNKPKPEVGDVFCWIFYRLPEDFSEDGAGQTIRFKDPAVITEEEFKAAELRANERVERWKQHQLPRQE
jgi:hypothetical protein